MWKIKLQKIIGNLLARLDELRKLYMNGMVISKFLAKWKKINSRFWNDLKSVLDSFNITIRFDIMNVLFGILDTDNISILVNYIILESKYFIYRCKLNKGCLCVRLLVDKFKKTFQTERFIAKRNNKIHFHDKKWKPLLPLIQQ